ncbi:MAG: serine/threonine protein kinase [Planctomycetes bacterium]|nr:serine/threonine protein kinase [Planctomycetota bacterium]
MSDPPRPDSGPARTEDERLVHALVSRGLITREEAQECRAGQTIGARKLLARLVECGSLTANQAARAEQELSMLLGQQIPGYQLLEKLGQGSMGEVFKARQLSLNRIVAVKVVQPRWAAKPEFLEGLRREAHLAARLSHNNIVQAVDVGSAGPLHYFVMEYVEGTTIRQLLDSGKVFGEREAVEIVLQLAQALEHAHRRGLIHRDIKPANVILTPDGVVKLADLGMARNTADDAVARKERGLTIGTPFYIAPEQVWTSVRGVMDIDGRADLYALGATLYHMVTGQPPFPYKDVDAVFTAHRSEELTPPDHIRPELSNGLAEVVELLMAKDRRQRYQKAEDLIIDLECLLNDEPPRLARQRIEASTLASLGEGEEEEESEEPPADDAPSWPIVYVLVGALALSLALNLLLFLTR